MSPLPRCLPSPRPCGHLAAAFQRRIFVKRKDKDSFGSETFIYLFVKVTERECSNIRSFGKAGAGAGKRSFACSFANKDGVLTLKGLS